MRKLKKIELAAQAAAETTHVDDSEKIVDRIPNLVPSKTETCAMDTPAKHTNTSTLVDEIVSDDEHDDLEEDIVVTHL